MSVDLGGKLEEEEVEFVMDEEEVEVFYFDVEFDYDDGVVVEEKRKREVKV